MVGAGGIAAFLGLEELAGAAAGAGRPVDPFTTPAMVAFLHHRTGYISAGLYDVATGTTFLYHPNDRQQTASIVKVDILATLLSERQLVGEPLSEDDKDLATDMIEQSDNDDATALWEEAGGAVGIAAFNKAAGMTQTTPNPDDYWGETLTSARDQLLLLRRVMLRNDLLHYQARDYAQYLMENVTPFERWGVSAGPPPTVTVALKNGWVPIVGSDWQVNSIGSIDGDGRHYLIVILTSGDDGESYGIDTIEGISRIVWSSMPRTSTSASFTASTAG
ncbi:MAG: serine hydrolase [Solirubrobacteraceae bacterium]